LVFFCRLLLPRQVVSCNRWAISASNLSGRPVLELLYADTSAGP
jgi:hypothetical protein